MNKPSFFYIYPTIVIIILMAVTCSCNKDETDDSGSSNTSPANTFTDSRDGIAYKTVTINNKVWMAENLKYLPSVFDPVTGSPTTPCYYVYGYTGASVSDAKATANYKTYGVLYNWAAAKVACPAGWHLPSDSEWTQLITYLGGESLAGGKLKEAGTTHWANPNTGATNESGFTALPGGYREINGALNFIGKNGYWWSGTEKDSSYSWYRFIFYNSSNISNIYFWKDAGLSVRCVKD